MLASPSSMLENPAVLRALDQTFHSTTIDHAEPLAPGLSTDLIYRITVKGSPYILRIMTRINERMDPARIFACMRAASGAGIAPPLRYSSPEDGITIIDFIDPVPFPASRALAHLPAILRKLHALPPFPKTFNYVTAHSGIIWRFRESNLLPAPEVEEVFTHYGRLGAAYPRLDADMVSCHSDLKPENILYDGRRAWLTGWQAAFVNDRYFDLALAANFLVRTEADELTYLAHYFDEQPSEYQPAPPPHPQTCMARPPAASNGIVVHTLPRLHWPRTATRRAAPISRHSSTADSSSWALNGFRRLRVARAGGHRQEIRRRPRRTKTRGPK